MIKNAKKPIIKLKLINHDVEHIIKLDQVVNTRNPNFSKIVAFEKI